MLIWFQAYEAWSSRVYLLVVNRFIYCMCFHLLKHYCMEAHTAIIWRVSKRLIKSDLGSWLFADLNIVHSQLCNFSKILKLLLLLSRHLQTSWNWRGWDHPFVYVYVSIDCTADCAAKEPNSFTRRYFSHKLKRARFSFDVGL